MTASHSTRHSRVEQMQVAQRLDWYPRSVAVSDGPFVKACSVRQLGVDIQSCLRPGSTLSSALAKQKALAELPGESFVRTGWTLPLLTRLSAGRRAMGPAVLPRISARVGA